MTENQPIACTLKDGDYQNRMAWIATITRDGLRGYARSELSLGLRYAPQSAQRVRDMVQQEQACCAFLTFQIHEQPDEVLLTITAPEAARATVDALFEPFLPSKAPTSS